MEIFDISEDDFLFSGEASELLKDLNDNRDSVFICYGCDKNTNIPTFFRDEIICETCFQSDSLLRHIMDMKKIEKTIKEMSDDECISKSSELLMDLKKHCLGVIRRNGKLNFY
jgi:hypothetical protein